VLEHYTVAEADPAPESPGGASPVAAAASAKPAKTKLRTPSYTDRVLLRQPLRAGAGAPAAAPPLLPAVRCLAYDAAELVGGSDHLPVIALWELPLPPALTAEPPLCAFPFPVTMPPALDVIAAASTAEVPRRAAAAAATAAAAGESPSSPISSPPPTPRSAFGAVGRAERVNAQLRLVAGGGAAAAAGGADSGFIADAGSNAGVESGVSTAHSASSSPMPTFSDYAGSSSSSSSSSFSSSPSSAASAKSPGVGGSPETLSGKGGGQEEPVAGAPPQLEKSSSSPPPPPLPPRLTPPLPDEWATAAAVAPSTTPSLTAPLPSAPAESRAAAALVDGADALRDVAKRPAAASGATAAAQAGSPPPPPPPLLSRGSSRRLERAKEQENMRRWRVTSTGESVAPWVRVLAPPFRGAGPAVTGVAAGGAAAATARPSDCTAASATAASQWCAAADHPLALASLRTEPPALRLMLALGAARAAAAAAAAAAAGEASATSAPAEARGNAAAATAATAAANYFAAPPWLLDAAAAAAGATATGASACNAPPPPTPPPLPSLVPDSTSERGTFDSAHSADLADEGGTDVDVEASDGRLDAPQRRALHVRELAEEWEARGLPMRR
jgi:hypothetical protein